VASSSPSRLTATADRGAAPTSAPADDDPKLLKRPQVLRRIGFSETKLKNLIRAGRFPKPVKIEPGRQGAARWVAAEVDQWIEEQIAAAR
jgi:prophage regulatory protein